MSEKESLLGTSSKPPDYDPIFQEKTKTQSFISVILVSVYAAIHNSLFALLLISLLAFAQVEFFLLFFIYRGHLARVHFWAIFVIGAFVVIEAISTDIIVGTSVYVTQTN